MANINSSHFSIEREKASFFAYTLEKVSDYAIFLTDPKGIICT